MPLHVNELSNERLRGSEWLEMNTVVLGNDVLYLTGQGHNF